MSFLKFALTNKTFFWNFSDLKVEDWFNLKFKYTLMKIDNFKQPESLLSGFR
jgi:hypothetical protein